MTNSKSTRSTTILPHLSQRWLPVLIVLLAVTTVACRQDMHDMARHEPLEESDFFSDGSSARQPVSHTVARGHLQTDRLMFTGIGDDGQWASDLPMELTAEVLARGQERYEIFCTPCHDRAGSGRGMIVERGFKQPPSYHEERLRQMPVGYFFNVASEGYGLMSGYKAQVKAEDRWAIAAWVRVLQRSRSPITSLPSEDQGILTSIEGAGDAIGSDSHDDSDDEGGSGDEESHASLGSSQPTMDSAPRTEVAGADGAAL